MNLGSKLISNSEALVAIDTASPSNLQWFPLSQIIIITPRPQFRADPLGLPVIAFPPVALIEPTSSITCGILLFLRAINLPNVVLGRVSKKSSAFQVDVVPAKPSVQVMVRAVMGGMIVSSILSYYWMGKTWEMMTYSQIVMTAPSVSAL